MTLRKNLYSTLGVALAVLAILLLTGCKGGDSCKRGTGDTATPDDTGGSGGGGTPSGQTVPGNAALGLAESPEAPRIPGGTSDERKVAQDVNDFRQQNGLSALSWTDALGDAERSHSYYCHQENYFGHGSHSDNSYNCAVERGKFLGAANYLWECAYAVGPSGAMNAWANSTTHRNAILTSGLTKHGVGISSNNMIVCWASDYSQ
jgi:uncharacterized protein YkwD